MIYDQTCRGQDGRLPLSYAWQAGRGLYGGLGRLDAGQGVSSWAEALMWLGVVAPDRQIAEIQFWGHGNWGCALVDRQPLDARALRAGHPLHAGLARVRERLAPEALWWFRTCETLGAAPGQGFARRWTDFFGGRVAGHTHIIGVWQSGLHSLTAGEVPRWSAAEGLATGTPQKPEKALGAAPWRPNTISFLHGTVPAGW